MKCYSIFQGLILLLLSISLSASSFTDPYPKNPNIDALHYAFKIEVTDEADVIEVQSTVDVRYKKAGIEQLRLDLIKASEALDGKGMTVSSVTSEGKPVAFTHENDALVIELAAPSVENQRISYNITYSGVPASGLKIGNNKHGDRTFFSDNWPNRGRNWLSTIDHPYDKATCEFIVTAPDHYSVVSNGLKLEESHLPDNKKLTHWKQSVPIAPWLYVLGVARFAIQYVDEFDGKPIETWVYPQDRDAGFYDFAIPTKMALEFYSDYVGPFSYERLANIQSNSVAGGMEAATAILYSESSVVGDRNERWRNVVIHEVAHQWFGNAVTEYDWDDIWLSEGFATYFTLLFIEHQYGRDEFLRGLASSKKRVDNFYAERPDYRIVHDNLKNMADVTTSQIYQKGSWILHMLRGVVGTDIFWKGIRSYYTKYKDLNATTSDFRKEMEEASGQDLETFFEQWLYKPGTLELNGSWSYDEKKKEVSLSIAQVQSDGSFFEMPIEVGLYFDGLSEPQIEKIQLNKKKNTYTIQVTAEPLDLQLDPNTWVLMNAKIERKD